jgi:aminopeptidase N
MAALLLLLILCLLPGRAAAQILWEDPLSLRPEPSRAVKSAAYADYDLSRVQLRIRFDPTNRWVEGSTLFALTSRKQGLLQVPFDLSDTLTVLSVESQGQPLLYSRDHRRLLVTLSQPLANGDSTQVLVAYQGHPLPFGFLGLGFDSHGGTGGPTPYPVPLVSSLSEPDGAPSWWPCKDVTSDRFTCETFFTVPDTLTVAGNGTLQETMPAGPDWTTYHWRESYPIATYLVSVAATNYVTWSDSYRSLDGATDMPVVYYAYPEDEASARAAWARTPQMIAAFALLFGEYPFLREKYGMAEFNWIGAMEHQTMTSYGRYYLGYDVPINELTVAHELAHQWWGDEVTPGDWNDIWLNEGFASYAEALWREQDGGPEAYRFHMREMERDYFDGPLAPPTWLFSTTTYLKGAWVLHMLRFYLGDEAFFNGLRLYRQEFAHAPASSEGLRLALEQASAKDLTGFFRSWVYGTGMPRYAVEWRWPVTADRMGPVEVTVTQEQADPVFSMPLPLVFGFQASAPETLTVIDSLRVQHFSFSFSRPPVRLLLDPSDWILKQPSQVMGPLTDIADGAPGWRSSGSWTISAPRPNPFRGWVVLNLKPREPGTTGATGEVSEAPVFSIVDASGRAWRHILPFSDAGGWSLLWDGRDELGHAAPGGIYWLVGRGSAQGLRQRIVRAP